MRNSRNRSAAGWLARRVQRTRRAAFKRTPPVDLASRAPGLAHHPSGRYCILRRLRGPGEPTPAARERVRGIPGAGLHPDQLGTGLRPISALEPLPPTGLPYIADPMLHVYNPLVSVPVLLLGVMDGFKVAVFLSFLAAALGMWALGGGWGWAVQPASGSVLMYAFSGPTVARFFQGQYLFIFGLAWIPWVLARLDSHPPDTATPSMPWARSWRWPFSSSPATRIACTCFCVAILALLMLFEVRRRKPRVSFDWDHAALLLLIAVMVVGVVAVYLFPLADFWPHIGKPTNPEMSDSHTVQRILLDYTSADTWRPDAMRRGRSGGRTTTPTSGWPPSWLCFCCRWRSGSAIGG